MDIPDLSKLTSEQERILGDAYRFIKQRAAWLRMKRKSAAKNMESKPPTSTTAEISDSASTHRNDNFGTAIKQSA